MPKLDQYSTTVIKHTGPRLLLFTFTLPMETFPPSYAPGLDHAINLLSISVQNVFTSIVTGILPECLRGGSRALEDVRTS